jgi:hypothetical protein
MARWINRTLTPFGLEVRRVSSPKAVTPDKYSAAVAELHGCISELVFPDLAPSEDRLKLLCELIGTPVTEGLYVVGLLSSSLAVDGDVCEFGVAQGATSALLANELLPTRKHLWLFDSFKGLPNPTEKDQLIDDIFNLGSIEKYAGTMANPVELVKQRLEMIRFPEARTHIVPGFIEETIKTAALPKSVCFAYVDFDFYEPILTALHFLRSRVPIGGTIMVDDYGWFSSGAKTAVDEFVEETGGEFHFSIPMKSGPKFCILRRMQRQQNRIPANGRKAS